MAEPNPYAPPKADDTSIAAEPAAAGDKPSYKLYSPGQVLLAAFLGSPVAGLYLLSENRRRLGHTSLANTTLVGGIVATVALIAVSFHLPDGVGRVLPAAISMAIFQYAKQDQPLLDAHRAKGGQAESSWKAAGLGLASLVGVLTLIVLLMLLTGDS